MTGIDEPAGIEERFLAAANTSDLTVKLDRACGADIIIAAGFAKNRLGIALIHLQSEWDRCDKPRKRTAQSIAARAATMKDKKGRPDIRRATIEATVWHASAMRERAAKLTGRGLVLGLLTDWATERGIDTDLLSPAIYHWLAPTCPACDGLGETKIPDTPSLSGKRCQHCQGVGSWPRPLGAQDIHDHMKKSIGQAKGQTAGALYG